MVVLVLNTAMLTENIHFYKRYHRRREAAYVRAITLIDNKTTRQPILCSTALNCSNCYSTAVTWRDQLMKRSKHPPAVLCRSTGGKLTKYTFTARKNTKRSSATTISRQAVRLDINSGALTLAEAEAKPKNGSGRQKLRYYWSSSLIACFVQLADLSY